MIDMANPKRRDTMPSKERVLRHDLKEAQEYLEWAHTQDDLMVRHGVNMLRDAQDALSNYRNGN